MNLFISMLLSGIFQVIIFLIPPMIWWKISNKNKESFFNWIGLKKATFKDTKKVIFTFILTLALLIICSVFILPHFVTQEDMSTSKFLGKGISALLPSLIYSFITTGLSEEILFRGFIGKRLINKFGLNIGNLIQAIIFGLLHGALFISSSGLFGAIVATLIPGTTGFLMGYIDEKLSSGSILPSWILHGCANVCASLIAMFNLV